MEVSSFRVDFVRHSALGQAVVGPSVARLCLLGLFVLGLAAGCSDRDEGGTEGVGADVQADGSGGVIGFPDSTGDAPDSPQPDSTTEIDTPVSTTCGGEDDCPDEAPLCTDAGVCVQCKVNDDCPDEQKCENGTCIQGVCTPDSRLCEGTTLNICNSTGSAFEPLECAPGICENGECKGCEAGTRQCQGAKLLECAAGTGTFIEVQDCGEAKLCSNSEQKCLQCFPLQAKCEGSEVWECPADGSGFALKETCGGGSSCVLGKCVSACSSDLKLNSNVGCDYWAVDLDNFNDPTAVLTAANAQYAVVVSNASDSPSEVKITGHNQTQPQVSATVPPKGLHIFNLPARNVDGTVKAHLAWRVQSTQPMVAYQFNPLENVGVYSNDASVLFPSNSWGTEYLAMSWKQYADTSSGAQTANAFVTIVAGFEGTNITIVPAGKTLGSADVPALAAGQSWETTLEPFEVLSIQSNGKNVDLTGTLVQANKPIGVFAGHECARTSEKTCCCDHLEQQMIPTSAWGKTYIAVRSGKRNFESDHWRILAKEDGTVITTNPAQASGLIQLNAGKFHDLDSKQSFKIEANKPVMVGQFLASSYEINGSCDGGCAPSTSCSPLDGVCLPTSAFCSGSGQSSCLSGHTCVDGFCEPIGDPAFILMPPVEQFLTEYVFLVPNNYVQDYLGVVAPVGAQITLDGNQPVNMVPLSPSAAWATATIPIADGTHTIASANDAKFGIVVHGFDDDVSYGYTGGLALEDLQK